MGWASRQKKARRQEEQQNPQHREQQRQLRGPRLGIMAPRQTTELPGGVAVFGLGGQQQFLVSVPRNENDPNHRVNRAVPQGAPGQYRVVISLQRLGYAVYPERSFGFGGRQGDSHIAIAHPAYANPALPDANGVLVEAESSDGRFTYHVAPNEKGFAAQISTTVTAQSFAEAERLAYRNVAPTLSHWATYFDVPVVTARIEMEDLQYGTMNISVTNPYDEVPLALAVGEPLEQPLRVLESFYREALNSGSSAYQFLCLCKILEGVMARRVRARRDAARAGVPYTPVDPETERIPTQEAEYETWLRHLFPARTRPWDAMALASIFIADAVGRTCDELFREGSRREAPGPIRAIRNEVAHAITEQGPPRLSADDTFYLQRVNEWLPITKCLARLLLLHEFPRQLWQPPDGAPANV